MILPLDEDVGWFLSASLGCRFLVIQPIRGHSTLQKNGIPLNFLSCNSLKCNTPATIKKPHHLLSLTYCLNICFFMEK